MKDTLDDEMDGNEKEMTGKKGKREKREKREREREVMIV